MNIISYLVTSPLHCLFLESDKWVLHQNMLTCFKEKKCTYGLLVVNFGMFA